MARTRRISELTGSDWDQLAAPCRGCAFWESGPSGYTDGAARKRAWLQATTAQWGRCGIALRVEDGADPPVGYALYAPPAYLPRGTAFPTSPAADDCVVLAAVWVAPALRGRGLGRALLTAVTADVTKRGVRAVEAFGRVAPLADELSCLLPVGWLVERGFAVVRDHPTTPRLRLDVRSLAGWREEVEGVLGRLRVQRGPRPQPAARTASSALASAGMRITPVGGSSACGR